MQKRLTFEIDYVCKSPYDWGAGSRLATSLITFLQQTIYFLYNLLSYFLFIGVFFAAKVYLFTEDSFFLQFILASPEVND